MCFPTCILAIYDGLGSIHKEKISRKKNGRGAAEEPSEGRGGCGNQPGKNIPKSGALLRSFSRLRWDPERVGAKADMKL